MMSDEVHDVAERNLDRQGWNRSVHSNRGDYEVNRTRSQCKFCGRSHVMNKLACPAWGKTCNTCGRKNHFAATCNMKYRERREGSKKPLKWVEESDSEEYIACLDVVGDVCAVGVAASKNKIFATMRLNDYPLCFQLDSGASVNVLSQRDYVKIYGWESLTALEDTNTTLVMYNKSEEKPLGKKRVRVVNPKNGKKYSVEFLVTKGDFRPLLGSRASQQMQLLSVNEENILGMSASIFGDVSKVISKESMTSSFADLFVGEGKLEGALHLEIDPAITPAQLPTRKVPIAIRDELKKELDRLEELRVLQPVDVPTNWISALVVARKKDGRIRVCIDPKYLNQVLKRNHYPLPTIEDILPQLSKARCFTVLDAKNGFWQVALDEESSFATTFGTPWGRYRWLRMPFGISPAPEEFQRRMDEALSGLKGCKAIADVVLVFGCGETESEAREDHDVNLLNVLQRCREKGVKLNGEKLQLRCKHVSYMGHLLTADGLKPDKSKVRAITEMPQPKDKQAVQRVLGMANYLQRFAPKLAEATSPLREIIKEGNEFVWDEAVQGREIDW